MSDRPPGQQIFAAFLEAPPRRRWPVVAVLAGVALTVGSLRMVAQTGTSVVTPYGIRTIEPGMTEHEVNHLLGKPFAAAASSPRGLDCFRYGYPNLESPSFVVYSLCYQEARLHDVSLQRYSAWAVAGDGTLVPPPPEER